MNAITRTLKFINNHPLAGKNKFESYYRLARWQFLSRIAKEEFIVVPFLENTKMLAKKGLTGVTGSIYTGLQEFEEMAFLLHFLAEDDCIFDVGANVGAYTILAAGVRKAKCLAFEPCKITWEILKKNIELNSLQDLVICENKGVGNNKGYLHFTNNQDTTNHVIASDETSLPYDEVEVVTLDEYHSLFHPNLMKIDVEGFENEVIHGANRVLSQPNLKAIIIELNGSGGRYGFNEKDIHSKLVELSFEPFIYEPFTRTLVKQPGFGSFNTIYIRDLECVQDKLKKGATFRIFNNEI